MAVGRPGRQKYCEEYQIDGLANCQTIGFEDISKKACVTSLFGFDQAKKNAGASPKATSVNAIEKASQLSPSDTLKHHQNAMSKFGKGAHKRAARMLGYALTAATADCWAKFSQAITARPTARERVSLAFMALKSLSHNDAHVCDLFSDEECYNYFKAAGYETD